MKDKIKRNEVRDKEWKSRNKRMREGKGTQPSNGRKKEGKEGGEEGKSIVWKFSLLRLYLPDCEFPADEQVT